jgi:PHD/YefM family antitoxin component YafN of YafNO toxin-antitoxin module
VETPVVIPITDFRRDTARIIATQTAAETPVYITQGGYVTAVVLSPERYRGLARLAERGMAADRAAEADARMSGGRQREAEEDGWPEDVFGFLDPETAEILANGGFDLE